MVLKEPGEEMKRRKKGGDQKIFISGQ